MARGTYNQHIAQVNRRRREINKQDARLFRAIEILDNEAPTPELASQDNWPPPSFSKVQYSTKENEIMVPNVPSSLIADADKRAELQEAINDEWAGANAANPDWPILAEQPEAQRIVAELEAASAEIAALDAEINAQFGDRLELAKLRQTAARQAKAAFEARMDTIILNVHHEHYEPQAISKWFTPEKLVTIASERRVSLLEDEQQARVWLASPDEAERQQGEALERAVNMQKVDIRRWCMENMPNLLEVKWQALYYLVEIQDKVNDLKSDKTRQERALDMPPQLHMTTVKVVRFNIEKLAALEPANKQKILDRALNGVPTQMTVKDDDNEL